MVSQARAEATRRRILDAAIDLFSDRGYGEVGLVDVLKQSGASKGAFYHHFDSKAALAEAIIEDGSARILEAFERVTRPSGSSGSPATPSLESVIRATFVIADVTARDKTARLANQLRQALGQVSHAGARTYRHRTALFLSAAQAAIAQGERRADIAIEDTAEAIWLSVLGCHLLSTAVGDNLFARLARAWWVLLGAVVPADSVADYREFVERTAARYMEQTG